MPGYTEALDLADGKQKAVPLGNIPGLGEAAVIAARMIRKESIVSHRPGTKSQHVPAGSGLTTGNRHSLPDNADRVGVWTYGQEMPTEG